LLAVVAAACAAGAGVFWFAAPVDYGLPFDDAAWRRDNATAFRQATYHEIYNATRDRMVNDLLRRYRLVGMTKHEVTALLGEPDYAYPELFPTWEMVYWLGPDHRGAMGHLDS